MAGKVVNSSFVLLCKFGACRQESASKSATSHIRKPLRQQKNIENYSYPIGYFNTSVVCSL